MLIKLATLGAMGYFGYRYLQNTQKAQSQPAPQIALAGGPLSNQATIQTNPDLPPAADWRADESSGAAQ